MWSRWEQHKSIAADSRRSSQRCHRRPFEPWDLLPARALALCLARHEDTRACIHRGVCNLQASQARACALTKYPSTFRGTATPLAYGDNGFRRGLPRSTGLNCIFIVVDKLSRYEHFMSLVHPFTAFQVAQAYIASVYKLHGLSSTILSNREKVFTCTP